MEKQLKPLHYTAVMNDFKRDAVKMVADQLPGLTHLLKRDIDAFLNEEKPQLHRWHLGMLLDYLTSDEFGNLFKSLGNAFDLKHLKQAGLSKELLTSIRQLLQKLFRAMMITAVEDRKEQHEKGWLMIRKRRPLKFVRTYGDD